MAPKIVRPRSDSPFLPLTLGAAAVCTVGGWLLGAWVFKPEHLALGDGTMEPVATADAGTSTDDVVVAPRAAVIDAGVAPVSNVVARMNAALLSACGDGEEMNIAGASCDNPTGLEPALRARLQATIAQCPAAASAARDPAKVLSLGVRVDFQRRRIVSLLGRSTSVPDKVTYVPCVNAALASLDEVWRLQGAHPRYQYFFSVRFAPVRETTPATPTPATPTAPAPPTTTPTDDAGAPRPIDPTLPTPAQMQRMPAMGQSTVLWPTAIVRETPRTGPISARITQHTPVEVVDRRGSWYGIRWQRTNTGWVYGDAIGQGRQR